MAVQKVNIGHVVGPGVPTGGAEGTWLMKKSGTNYDTKWAELQPVLVVDCGTINTLPKVISNANIKRDMVVVGYEFGTPEAFDDDLSVSTSNGWLTLSGICRKSTTVKLKLASASNDPSELGNCIIKKPWQFLFPDFPMLNVGLRNAVWRGNSLGNIRTPGQTLAIESGRFEDMYLGDYWEINGVIWRIMGFDVFWDCGDNPLSSHHVVVVPDTNLYNCKWNETANTTDGGPNGGIGYAGSFVRANIKSSVNGAAEGAELKVIAAFGSGHVLSYRTIYPSAYDTDGNATTFANFDARVELMSEAMVYGSQIFTGNGRGNGFEAGIEKTQLPGFRVNPRLIKSADYWLRNPYSKLSVCEVGTYGNATRAYANNEKGIRPFALIG